MRANAKPTPDPRVLAQLHATLEIMVDTDETLRASNASSPALKRLGQLMNETRALLLTLLGPQPALAR